MTNVKDWKVIIAFLCALALGSLNSSAFANEALVEAEKSVPTGKCECGIRQGIVSERECKACTSESQCDSKKCSVLVEEGGVTVQKKISCTWIPAKESCKACEAPAGWHVVVQCPSEADVGACGNYECTMVKLGYTGPLVPGPNVRISDCTAQ